MSERASETLNEPVFSLLVQIKDASVIAGGRIRDVDAIRLEILRRRRRGDVERVVRPQKERAVTPKVRDASPRAAAAVELVEGHAELVEAPPVVER